MEAYFDNSATTKVLDCVKDAVVDAMCVNYGNAAAKHRKGVEAENLIREAKKAIADTLKVQEKEILFTSGGTESNNTALIGTALANRRAGKHLITTGVEHPSIYNTMSFLEEMGFEVTYLPVDHLGHISLEDLEKAIREDTILVSVMYVNNEVGAVEPIEAISQCIKKKNPKTLFHVDAIQAYGKYKIRPKKQGIDLLSVSGHKIHAPKGVGFLYIRDGVKIRPILFGGGQQKGMRSGTENVPGCVGLGVAAREAYKDFDARIEKLYTLRERLIAGLKLLGGVTINGSEDRTNAPQIVSASFEGVRSEVLLHALEDKGVYVSSGSACSSNHPGISGTLKGIGVKKELLDSTIRFSLGDLNVEEEVDYAIGVLGELLPVLRRYQMK
ncbi:MULTISPECIES: cysteine desulfurase family protein [Clostridium]|jgi:cysteine desulfurase|uniref:Cysteine desulfurase NifS n=2 Tax=Clostridium TaxID=1485 RepID=A0A2T3FLN0_9CLOT|nr:MULTISPECIES: cysteine desulfurase family protein [Clostridium]PST36180.1 cysteine desulfurase NifS [Clostridium fessum]RHO11340.1 cysteine desulfurase [Clostridium sp. AM18-55]